MVDSWTRYAHAEPIKPKNAKTVGSAISKFVGSLGYVGAVEVCGDNENVLVSGMEFFKQVRARQGFSTTVTTNRNYSKDRTSICERTIQTVCNLQKTLVMQLEESIKCKIPQGHAVLYWTAMHSTWLYNRYHTHSTTKITPYQAVNGRPYHNRIACFGQVTYGLDPKGSKYRPTWKKGIWLGKDVSDHGVLATAAGTITRTRSIRRTALTWSADEILSLVIGPWDTTGYTQSKVKQKPVLALPPRPFFDEEAEAVKGLQDSDDEREQAQQEVQSNAYEPTTPDGEGPRLEDVTERDDGRVPVPSLPPLCAVPVDPGMEAPQTPEEMLMSGAGGASPSSPTMDVDSSGHAASKHKAETQDGTVAKALKFDSDPVPEPKVKAAKMDVRRIGEVEITHNDVIGLEDDWEFLPYEDVDSEDESINKRLEEDGPPTVSPEKLAELDAQAALDEVAKLYEMHVIAPEEIDVRTIPSHKLVDTTIASDWRYRESKWRRRCRIVAREFKSDNTDENSFAPTTTFGAVRILLVLSMVFSLMLTGIDVKDAFLCVEQQEEMFVVIPQWIRDLSPEDRFTVWRLKRCLPGQRNAALRWFEYFSSLCQSAGMESYKGCPTIRLRLAC